jgi:hypothetical protein
MKGSSFRRVAAVMLLVSVVVLASSAPASAAVCVRLSTTPVRPVIGQPVQVELRTLTSVAGPSGGFRLEPHAVVATYPFHVTAKSADQIVLIHVQRTAEPNLWTGEFVLGESGLWHLVVENLERTGAQQDPRCYSELSFAVSAAGGQPEQSGPTPSSIGVTLLLAVGVLALLVGTTLFVVIRSRVRPPGP